MERIVPSSDELRRRALVVTLAVAAAVTVQMQTPLQADAATSLSTRRVQMDTLTDEARKRAGCKPLRISDRLNTSAQRHARDMSANSFLSHTSSNGTTWMQRIKAAGYPYPGGENISRGRSTAAEAMRYLLASSSHKRNITNCAFTRIGIGYVASGNYWVQDFGY